jgi:hypothetical protein
MRGVALVDCAWSDGETMAELHTNRAQALLNTLADRMATSMAISGEAVRFS